MLETKTRNNLLAQEAKILEGLLADLRMQYVSMTGSASASASRPLTGATSWAELTSLKVINKTIEIADNRA